MDEYLTLGDGTVVENSYVVKMGDESISIHAPDETDVVRSVGLFCDHTRICAIHSYQFGEEQDWNGYINVTAIVVNNGGTIVCLAKGAE